MSMQSISAGKPLGGGAAPQRLTGSSGEGVKSGGGAAPQRLTSVKPRVNKGGKISRLKKFNRFSKAVGQKFLPIAKNLKPLKEAAAERGAQMIREYNNPEAIAKSALDTFQEEAPQTLAAFRQPRQSVVYAEPVPYEPEPTAYPFPSVPSQYFFPPVPKQEELPYEPVVYYGSGTKKPAKGSPEMKAKMAALRAMKGGAGGATESLGTKSRAAPQRLTSVKPRVNKGSAKPAAKPAAPKPAKGSQEMKDKMAALRAMKKSGGALYPAGY